MINLLNDNEIDFHKQDVKIFPRCLNDDDRPMAPCPTINTSDILDPNVYCTGYDIQTNITHGLDSNTDWYGHTEADDAQVCATAIPEKKE